MKNVVEAPDFNCKLAKFVSHLKNVVEAPDFNCKLAKLVCHLKNIVEACPSLSNL